jgi:hypothetical protein
MTDLDRLLSAPDTDDLERDLLEAGAREAPSAEARQRTLSALGIPGGRQPADSGATTPALAARPLSSTRALRLLTWFGLATLAAISVREAASRFSRAPSPARPAASATAATPAHADEPTPDPGVVTPSTLVTAPSVASDSEIASAPSAAPSAAVAASSRPSPAPAPAKRAIAGNDGSSLAAEIAALERARTPLQRGDTAAALRALDDYRRTFPRGVMAPEAAVLRIEALAKSGRLDAARALASRFLTQNPKSPHAEHVRRLVGGE